MSDSVNETSNIIDMKLDKQPDQTSEPASSVEFAIPAKFTPKQIIEDMAKMAQFMNRYVGAMLTSGTLSAVNPATVGLMQASASLEQGATGQVQQLRELHAQQQAMQGGGFVTGQGGPGGGPGGPGGPRGPQRFN